jgi:hypothetical protein
MEREWTGELPNRFFQNQLYLTICITLRQDDTFCNIARKCSSLMDVLRFHREVSATGTLAIPFRIGDSNRTMVIWSSW